MGNPNRLRDEYSDARWPHARIYVGTNVVVTINEQHARLYSKQLTRFQCRPCPSATLFNESATLGEVTRAWQLVHSPIDVKSLQRVVPPRRLLLKSTRYS